MGFMGFMSLFVAACSSGGSEAPGGSAAAPVTQPGTGTEATTVAGAGATAQPGELGPEAASPPAIDTSALPVDARPTSARGAVEAFLVAQVTGDFTASYHLLSDADRAVLGESDWALAQTEFPRHLGFEVTAEQELVDGSGTQVAVTARYESSIDEIAGLIPARASEVWTVVSDSDAAGWRVDLARSTSTPILPPDADALTAVSAWAGARQACNAPEEYPGLVGYPVLAERLCESDGDVLVGMAQPLTSLDDPNPYLSAFGSDAASWGRVVELVAPTELRVVVAPVDDRWLVIGIAPPGAGGA